MLGNPLWFKRRKYTGWGITPNCWQGWLYIVCVLSSIFIVYGMGKVLGLQVKHQLMAMGILLILIIADSLDIALKIKKDEREIKHEAMAERNVTWYMSFVLTMGVLYQAITSALYGSVFIDPFIILAILGGVIVKAATNWYLIDK
jgi:hypothetical protein